MSFYQLTDKKNGSDCQIWLGDLENKDRSAGQKECPGVSVVFSQKRRIEAWVRRRII